MLNKDEYKNFTSKMDKSISVMEEELATIRAGRANPAILSKLTVEYYGVQTPISQVGNISVPEARMLVFTPWDASVLKAVEKEIQKSDIGINPANDGKVIKLVFPPLTEERRRDLTKQVRKYGEECKVAIRSIRRDANDYFKNLKKKSEITEDDEKLAGKEMQDATDKHIAEIDKIVAAKEKEIMEI
ncbi:MAG: ribosome recycling factor [Clostridia bacterium]|nr:ribosome recycling factor [Clostridia bacterium]